MPVGNLTYSGVLESIGARCQRPEIRLESTNVYVLSASEQLEREITQHIFYSGWQPEDHRHSRGEQRGYESLFGRDEISFVFTKRERYHSLTRPAWLTLEVCLVHGV